MLEKTCFLTKSFRFITIVMLITWLILPLIPIVIWSFSKGWFFPHLLPKYWSLDAWDYALSSSTGILESLWLTLFISLSATFLSILVGVPAGRALGMYKFKGKEIEFLNIDTEGNDLEVLKSLDFKKYKPKLICVELIDHFNPDQKKIEKHKIYKFLMNKKYQLVWSGHFSHIFKL